MIKIQQGDLILEVSELPQGATKVKFDGIVLKGEGVNTHEIVPADVEVYEKDGVLFLNVKKETVLKHSEHGNQVVEPGVYKRIIEREFDYETEEARQTRD